MKQIVEKLQEIVDAVPHSELDWSDITDFSPYGVELPEGWSAGIRYAGNPRVRFVYAHIRDDQGNTWQWDALKHQAGPVDSFEDSVRKQAVERACIAGTYAEQFRFPLANEWNQDNFNHNKAKLLARHSYLASRSRPLTLAEQSHMSLIEASGFVEDILDHHKYQIMEGTATWDDLPATVAGWKAGMDAAGDTFPEAELDALLSLLS